MDNIVAAEVIQQQVAGALAEDLGGHPDYTANLIPIDQQATARITTNQDMVLCGIAWAAHAFASLDAAVQLKWHKEDGDRLGAGGIIAEVTGNARSILTAERTALNFLQTLSATATLVNQYVERVQSTNVKIMDTRKTIPGLRIAQKYAVRVGGGYNQRVGLYDGVLIKENHIMACGGVRQALEFANQITPKHIPIQIEVENRAELEEALAAGATLILLDNMSVTEIRECVLLNNGQAELEASGNINLDNVLEYAQTGVERISIGKLTKNIAAIDLSLRFEPQ